LRLQEQARPQTVAAEKITTLTGTGGGSSAAAVTLPISAGSPKISPPNPRNRKWANSALSGPREVDLSSSHKTSYCLGPGFDRKFNRQHWVSRQRSIGGEPASSFRVLSVLRVPGVYAQCGNLIPLSWPFSVVLRTKMGCVSSRTYPSDIVPTSEQKALNNSIEEMINKERVRLDLVRSTKPLTRILLHQADAKAAIKVLLLGVGN
jgi:hypothetical protein